MNNKMQELAAVMQMSQGPGLGEIARLAQFDQRQREFNQTQPLRELGAINGLLNTFMQSQNYAADNARQDTALGLQEQELGLRRDGEEQRVLQWLAEQEYKKRQQELYGRQVNANVANLDSLRSSRDAEAALMDAIMGQAQMGQGGSAVDPAMQAIFEKLKMQQQ